ncbi:MAG: hypothetical protein WAO78_16040, partial [Roseovarius sp.]
DLGLTRGDYSVALNNAELSLMSVLTFQGSGLVEMRNGVFRMEIDMGVDLFGIATIAASGFFSSEGEFALSINGEILLGSQSFGIWGSLGMSISNLDSNGNQPFGDGNKVLSLSGHIAAGARLFGISLGSFGLGLDYNSASGNISATVEVDLLVATATATFNVGYIKPPPPIYLAGNIDDAAGTSFHGGVLVLNAGDRATYRGVETGSKDEFYEITHKGFDQDSGLEILEVKAMGRKQYFIGATKIVADMGDGFDYVTVGSGVLVPVEIRGAVDENDTTGNQLSYLGQSTARITGGAGQDTITTGSGNDWIDAGLGDDTIDAGSGRDTIIFVDNFGNDTLTTAGTNDIWDLSASTNGLTGSINSVSGGQLTGSGASLNLISGLADTYYTGSGDDNWRIDGLAGQTVSVTDAGGKDSFEFVIGNGSNTHVTVSNTNSGANNDTVGFDLDSAGRAVELNDNKIVVGTNDLTFDNGVAARTIRDSSTATTLLKNTVGNGSIPMQGETLFVNSAGAIDLQGIVNVAGLSLTAVNDVSLNNNVNIPVGGATTTVASRELALISKTGIVDNKLTRFVAPDSYLQIAGNLLTGPIESEVASITVETRNSGSGADIVIHEADSLSVKSRDLISGDVVTSSGIVSRYGNIDVTLNAASATLATELGAVIRTAGLETDITLTANEIDFEGGRNTIMGSGLLTVQATTTDWIYRLGSAADTIAGADQDLAGTMTLGRRELEALKDGFSLITIGREDAGNEMFLGDAMPNPEAKGSGFV